MFIVARSARKLPYVVKKKNCIELIELTIKLLGTLFIVKSSCLELACLEFTFLLHVKRRTQSPSQIPARQ